MLVVFILNMENAFGQSVELKLQASGFIKPVDISSTGDTGDNRLFIVEKDGLIRILKKDGSVLSLPFIDIDTKVNSQANERGLHGYFFVNIQIIMEIQPFPDSRDHFQTMILQTRLQKK